MPLAPCHTWKLPVLQWCCMSHLSQNLISSLSWTVPPSAKNVFVLTGFLWHLVTVALSAPCKYSYLLTLLTYCVCMCRRGHQLIVSQRHTGQSRNLQRVTSLRSPRRTLYIALPPHRSLTTPTSRHRRLPVQQSLRGLRGPPLWSPEDPQLAQRLPGWSRPMPLAVTSLWCQRYCAL